MTKTNFDFKQHALLIESLIPKNAKKLNLGCGADYRQGWTNLDAWSNEEIRPDVFWDLRKLPLPFEDNTFDYIFSAHTLEHIEGKLTGLVIELWRILKPNGILEIRVPHASHIGALEGMEHRNSFCKGSFGIFCNTSYFKHIPEFPELSRRKAPLFEYVRFRLRHQRTDDGNRFLIVKKGLYYHVAQMINVFADMSPDFCEKIWCYWVGGFMEMQSILRKIK